MPVGSENKGKIITMMINLIGKLSSSSPTVTHFKAFDTYTQCTNKMNTEKHNTSMGTRTGLLHDDYNNDDYTLSTSGLRYYLGY